MKIKDSFKNLKASEVGAWHIEPSDSRAIITGNSRTAIRKNLITRLAFLGAYSFKSNDV